MDDRLASSSTSAEHRRRALGRGLSALLGREALDEGAVREIAVSDIRPGPFQPRGPVAAEDLADLIASVRERGVIQPVVVRPVEDGYELVAGERRWRAAVAAGLTVLPAVVRRLSDQEALEVALIENLLREDLSPLERARAYRRLHQEFGLTHEQIAARLHRSPSSVANTLRLLHLPPEVQHALEQGRLSEGHGRALLGLADEEAIVAAAREVQRRNLTVRQAERLVRRWGAGPRRRGRPRDLDLQAVEEELTARFKTRVTITGGRRGGRIAIAFYSLEDLDRLVALLQQAAEAASRSDSASPPVTPTPVASTPVG